MRHVVHKCAYNNFNKIYPFSQEMDSCRCENVSCICSICIYEELALSQLMKTYKK